MRISRHLLVRVTAPAVAVGFVLLGASVLGIQSVNRLEAQQAAVLAKNVSSLRAAQQLELQLRQLRFHSLMLALDPGLDRRRRLVEDDQHAFEKAFQVVQATATSPDEKSLVQEI